MVCVVFRPRYLENVLVRLGGMAAGRRPTPEAAVGAMLAYVEACLVPGARP